MMQVQAEIPSLYTDASYASFASNSAALTLLVDELKPPFVLGIKSNIIYHIYIYYLLTIKT